MKVRQLAYILIIFIAIGTIANGGEKLTYEENKITLSALGVNARILRRMPANFIPDDDVELTPFDQTLWIDHAMAEDNAGILKNMKEEVIDWQEKEEYSKEWSLESTGLYFYPDRETKKRFMEKNLLKYFDKRLSGEIKKADEGSTLHAVGKARNAMRPSGTVGFSKQFKLKLRAKLLLRQARVIVINPWAQCYGYANDKGDLRFHIRKDIKAYEMQANIDYDIDDKFWVATISKKLFPNIYGTISSQQSPNEMMFTNQSDRIIKFNYFKMF